MERRKAAVSAGIAAPLPIFAQEASGAQITDVDGNTFIDFTGGIGVLNVGHANPRVVEKVRAQVEKMTHTCFATIGYEPYVELAEKLNALVPGNFEKRSAFFNSGAEAVENAVKTARYYTGRNGVLAFENAFHGRTLLTMTLTSKIMPYKKNFGPFAPEVYRAPAPYPYRCPVQKDCSSSCQGNCMDLLTRGFTGTFDPENLAAIIVEPVSGEGGFIPFPDFYLRRLREICDEYGIVLIADEVQTGFGRTGKMFAIEHSGVVPDMVTTAKSMGGGLPIGGVTGRKEIMDSVHPGGLGTTYGGNPLAMAAGQAVFDVVANEDFLARVREKGERLRSALEQMIPNHDHLFESVRGVGLMLGVRMKTDSRAFVNYLRTKGLLTVSAGDNVMRVLPPLTIEEEHIREFVDTLSAAAAEYEVPAEAA